MSEYLARRRIFIGGYEATPFYIRAREAEDCLQIFDETGEVISFRDGVSTTNPDRAGDYPNSLIAEPDDFDGFKITGLPAGKFNAFVCSGDDITRTIRIQAITRAVETEFWEEQFLPILQQALRDNPDEIEVSAPGPGGGTFTASNRAEIAALVEMCEEKAALAEWTRRNGGVVGVS